jgi:hypothetical protein
MIERKSVTKMVDYQVERRVLKKMLARMVAE